jgi:hypothetical protein
MWWATDWERIEKAGATGGSRGFDFAEIGPIWLTRQEPKDLPEELLR